MPQQISSTVQNLHTQFRFYGKNAREWMRKCVLMLPELDRERVWEKKGYGSLPEYAGRLSGMSKEMVYEGLRVLRAVEGMSEIMKVIEVRGIGIVRPVLTLLTVENQQFWAEKMRVMSLHTLQMYRRELEQQAVSSTHRTTLQHHDSTVMSVIVSDSPLDKTFRFESEKTINSPQQEAIREIETHHSIYQVRDLEVDSARAEKTFTQDTTMTTGTTITMTLDPEIALAIEKLRGKDGDWNTLMEEFLELRAQKLEQQKPPEKQTPSRYIPAKIERFVIERSRGVCEVGSCKQQYTILHHVQRFASEQVHDPDRIIALCTAHERLVHLGLIEDESIAPRKWKVLEKPDQTNPKYHIDQLVQKYRRPG